MTCKNRWGSAAEQNGKRLKAAVRDLTPEQNSKRHRGAAKKSNQKGSYDVTIVVEWLNKANAYEQVAFFYTKASFLKLSTKP